MKFNNWKVEPEPGKEEEEPLTKESELKDSPTWSRHTYFANNVSCGTTTHSWVKVLVEIGGQPVDTTIPNTIESLQQMLK